MFIKLLIVTFVVIYEYGSQNLIKSLNCGIWGPDK